MIQRIVMLKFNDENANTTARSKVVDITRRTLGGLSIIQNFEVGIPGDKSTERKWDMSVILYFKDLEDVQTYLVDPTHRKLVDEVLRPASVVIKAWNMKVGDRG